MYSNKVSLVTTCMNRSEFLVKSIQNWLPLGFAEIIVLDWSSNTPIVDTVKALSDKIVVARIDGLKQYNICRAKNTVCRLSTRPYILSVDADILLHPMFIKSTILPNKVFYTGGRDSGDKNGLIMQTNGSLFVRKDRFFNINGYNEMMSGYGFDDDDIRDRLIKSGLTWKRFMSRPLKVISHQNHSETLRVENYKVKNRMKSKAQNKKIAVSKKWDKNTPMQQYDATIYEANGSVKKRVI